jgi:hypothetical protein
MTAQQLAALLDQPLWKIEQALASLRAKGLVETKQADSSTKQIEATPALSEL